MRCSLKFAVLALTLALVAAVGLSLTAAKFFAEDFSKNDVVVITQELDVVSIENKVVDREAIRALAAHPSDLLVIVVVESEDSARVNLEGSVEGKRPLYEDLGFVIHARRPKQTITRYFFIK